MSDKRYTVRVDHDLCVGNAMCRATAPNVFVEDAGGQSVVSDPTGDSFEAIMDAAASCPVGAIEVNDAETGEPIES